MRSVKVVLLHVLLCLAAGLAPHLAYAQCPEKTTVADSLRNADGSLASGRVVIAWPTFHAGECTVIAGQVSVNVLDGDLEAALYPNEGATPAGTSYRVTYYLRSGRITTEYWVVPAAAGPVALAVVRSPSVPVPAMMFSQAQVINLLADLARRVELPSPCPAGKFLQSTGEAQVNCVDGTGAPLASPEQSGTVKTDTTDGDPRVYLQSSVDSLLAGKAAASHTHAAADTTSGTFDPARIPALPISQISNLQIELDGRAALSHTHAAADVTSGMLDAARLPNPAADAKGGVLAKTCTGTDKLSAIGTDGVPVCSADQTGETGGGITSLGGQTGATQTFSKVDDTNVTLTIDSGAPSANNHRFTIGWTGALAAARLNTNVVQAITNDTNVTGSIAAQNLTLGWTGTLAVARGGTGTATANSNLVFAGPTSGDPAAPSFRALLAGDIPDLSSVYQPLDADLTAIAALSTTGFARRTGADTWALAAASGTGGCTNQFVRTLNDAAAPTCASVVTADITDANVTPAKQSAAGRTFTKSFVLLEPVTGDSGMLQVQFPVAVTITRVSASVQGGTSVTLNLDKRAETTPNTAGTDVLSAGLVADTDSQTSCAAGCDVNTITSGAVSARQLLALTISAVSGTVSTVRVHVEYTKD